MEPLGPLGRALACSAFAALTVPLVLLSSRSWIAISALIVAVVGAIYQIDVRTPTGSTIAMRVLCSQCAAAAGDGRAIGLLDAHSRGYRSASLFLVHHGGVTWQC